MPTPPAAGRRWYSISSSVTRASGVAPSNVAALMTRFRRRTGPSRAGARTSGPAPFSFDDGDIGLAAHAFALGPSVRMLVDHRSKHQSLQHKKKPLGNSKSYGPTSVKPALRQMALE